MLRENFDLDKAVAEHLRANYGTRALPLAKMAMEEKDLIVEINGSKFPKRLSNKHQILEAEVIFACRSHIHLCIYLSIYMYMYMYMYKREQVPQAHIYLVIYLYIDP